MDAVSTRDEESSRSHLTISAVGEAPSDGNHLFDFNGLPEALSHEQQAYLGKLIDGSLQRPGLGCKVLLQILRAACARSLEGLKQQCVAALEQLICASNCAEILQSADTLALPSLRDAAMNHIIS
jgi:hypothetical protein